MNLGDMLEEMYATFGQNEGQAAHPKVTNRFTRYLNSAYRQTIGQKGFQLSRRATIPITTVANDENCVVPLVCSRIIDIIDRTNQNPLDEVPLQDIRRIDPGLLASASTPKAYARMNMAAALGRDPSAAAELFVKSTSVNDGAGVQAYLDGYITGGYPTRKSVPLNGTTAASFDSSVTTWTGGLKFYLSSACQGDVTINQGSGAGTELARIPAGRTMSRYTRIIITPVPSSAFTLYADVELAVLDLEQLMDEPLFDEDYHGMIVARAEAREWLKKTQPTLAGICESRAVSIQRDLKVKWAKEGGVGTNRAYIARFSQLGGYFEPGT